VSTRERRRDRALARTDRVLAEVGSQIRTARTTAGLSLRAAASAVDLDFATYSLIERARLPSVTVRQLIHAGAAVGLDVAVRAYLAGDAVRDAAHIDLLARLRARIPAGIPFATEVSLPIPGDLRALDAWARLIDGSIGFEAETRLADLQAVGRKVQLKKRDAALDRMVLVIRESRRNREVLALHRDALRDAFPLDTRAVLTALARGRLPEADGIVVL
jgi:transcriptional regulator with XRE-family HTH domain